MDELGLKDELRNTALMINSKVSLAKGICTKCSGPLEKERVVRLNRAVCLKCQIKANRERSLLRNRKIRGGDSGLAKTLIR